MMKAITLTQPWATEMALGFKHYETRSWSTSWRGELAIHAAKGFPAEAQQFAWTERAVGRVPERLPRGAIVAVVNVLDCLATEYVRDAVSALERHLGDYSTGRYAFQTELICALPEPVGCQGALGIWTVPEDIEQLVRQQMQEES